MRLLVLVPCLVLAAVVGCGDPPTTDETKSPNPSRGPLEPRTLSVGDPAPPWTVSNWLNGPAVEKAEPGKVYVLEFWATWCGPCIKAMPHLTEMQAQHRDQGLVIIGMTGIDGRGNDLKKVTQFVERMGPKLGYVIGFDSTGLTDQAYMLASGQQGIPCSFVIGRDGKVAYIGHPGLLDDVLPKVLAGTWQGKADLDAIHRMNAELERVFTAPGSPEMALAKFEEFGKAHQEVVKRPEIQSAKLGLLVSAKKWDDVKALGETLLATAEKKQQSDLAMAVLPLGNPQVNPDKHHLALAVSAADLLVKLEDRNPQVLLNAAIVYMTDGKREKAEKYGRQAVDWAPSDKARQEILKLLDQILTAKKGS
jgi:thiol-disulfide isomerase/thioredoxin